MADNRTMAQMLQAPIEGYEDAIVVPPINANNFELKQPLINLVQSINGYVYFTLINKTISGNPTPSPIPYEDSDSLMEEIDILLSHFDDSPPEYETFSFDIEEDSSGSTTIHSDYSLPDYEAFYFDYEHIEEKSSGNTTTHFDFSLPEYDSFIFDLSIDPLPLDDRSDFYHEEFADELDHIRSPPEYDYFDFDLEADPREFTSVLEKDLIDLSTKKCTSIKLNDSSFLLYDSDSSLSKEFSKIDLLVSFPSENEDIVIDPGIIIEGVQFQRFQIPLKKILLSHLRVILFSSMSTLRLIL
ncbi:hypothetical protein Tco_0173167 [Tanacetum coccineum]